jgi:fructokinase
MILVCGEAIIDMFVTAKADGSLIAEPIAGGSPYNVALGLARLGSHTGFLGGLSNDAFGRMMSAKLERAGIDLDFSPRSDRPSTLVVVSVDAAGVPTYRFIGEGAADRMLTVADLPATLPDNVKALTFGSLSMGVEPAGATYLALAEREKGRRVISVDPNLRASVVGDIANWKVRLERFIATANIVKSSIEDIEGTYSHGASVPAVVAGWMASGPSLVIVTRGGDGATAYWPGGTADIAGRKVAVVDTVGAGDTFHAALLNFFERKGLLTQQGLGSLNAAIVQEAIAFAAAAAAVTCTRRGADMPSLADAEAMLRS